MCGKLVSFLESLIRFDMEDAMILNKSSVERGLHYGQVYKVFDFLMQVLSSLLHLPTIRFFSNPSLLGMMTVVLGCSRRQSI